MDLADPHIVDSGRLPAFDRAVERRGVPEGSHNPPVFPATGPHAPDDRIDPGRGRGCRHARPFDTGAHPFGYPPSALKHTIVVGAERKMVAHVVVALTRCAAGLAAWLARAISEPGGGPWVTFSFAWLPATVARRSRVLISRSTRRLAEPLAKRAAIVDSALLCEVSHRWAASQRPIPRKGPPGSRRAGLRLVRGVLGLRGAPMIGVDAVFPV